MKRQKILRLELLLLPMLLLTVMLMGTTAFAAEPDLTGYTAISTKEQLNAVRSNLSGKYYLTTNIVFTAEDFAEGGAFYHTGSGWQPIGSVETPFTGVFDGNGCTITGLRQNLSGSGTTYGGLFGYVKGGTIRNLGMLDSEISVTTSSGVAYVGGIAGYVDSGTISSCCNTGSVSGRNGYAGGIAGDVHNGGMISSCYNTGSVVNGSTAGGIAGSVHNSVHNSSMISSCYNTGSVSAYTAGGIAGGVNGTVSNCYNTGSVTGDVDWGGYAGGIAGAVYGTVSSCYYLDRIGWGIGNGTDNTISCTIEQMQEQARYVGFDFGNIWQMGNGEYPLPVLRSIAHVAEPLMNETEFAGGNGTPYAPFQIETKTHLDRVRNHLDAWFILTDNIVLEERDFRYGGMFYDLETGGARGWQPIGSVETPFTGGFDGNGYTITGLRQNLSGSGRANGGLFGLVRGGTIRNLGMIDSDIHADDRVGGIAGCVSCGTIINCYNTGIVSGNSDAGGIAGGVYGSTIISCYNTGSVSGSTVGGITGSGGMISNCYNTGSVTGAVGWGGYAGGITGNGKISSCYNTGSVSDRSNAGGIAGSNTSPISNCYYLDRIGRGGGNGTDNAVSCTIEQMQEQVRYVGFDFENVWQMGNGEYPLPVLRSVAHIAEPPMNKTEFAGGNGTPYAPYIITDKAQLSHVQNYPDACFKMTDSIVFAAADFAPGGAFYHDGSGWQPIGSAKTSFTGIFDGNGCTITGLRQNLSGSGTTYGGLFGYVNGAAIRNLGMIDSDIHADDRVGGIAGYVDSGMISSCCNTGSVSGPTAGGIAGYVDSGTISSCHNTGSVSGSTAGGIAGFVHNNSTISSCYNTGSVSDSTAGGIAGVVYGTVSNCYNTGKVGGSCVGGIAGRGGMISNCYNTGSVTGDVGWDGYAGGIAGEMGYNKTAISYCYNAGSVSGSTAGGIAGNVYSGTISYCYYLDNISQGVGSGTDNATRCTDAELQDQGTFLGFNFKSIWTMKGNEDYPYPELRVHHPGATVSGQVTSYNPKNPVMIELRQGTDVIYRTEIAAGGGSGLTTRAFEIENVAPGTYDLVVTKAGHLTYTVRNITVASEDVDLTTHTNAKISTVTLLCGDINGDGFVNTKDRTALKKELNKSGFDINNQLADINGDGFVNTKDRTALKKNLNMSAANDCSISY